jgi:hypothetical protein
MMTSKLLARRLNRQLAATTPYMMPM